MSDNKTIFQKLTSLFTSNKNTLTPPTAGVNSAPLPAQPTIGNNQVLATFDSKEERDEKLKALKQQRYLSYQWAKTGYDTAMERSVGLNQVKVMYRDADLMDAMPEIGAALDIISEESTCLNKDKKMLNIYSSSKRVKAVLEDLFVNRLDINIILPMVARATAKYGNNFRFLNIDAVNGVMGWREMPVHEMQRVENGMLANVSHVDVKPNQVKFVWEGHNQSIPYYSWQMAHFRLVKDSIFMPYGCSWLNKARRAWRMLTMAEDAMLLYRLERSIERRIFKVNVGAIDDADVPAFLQEFMNNIKRGPIIDPETGQMDLRKNFLDVSADYVIPVRSTQDPTEITTLQGAQNQTSIEDIEFFQNKVLSALRIPKTFLNFQAAEGKGQNLSIMDVRFCRTVNTLQQAILMELTKIAIIHLKILKFDDDLTNFTLTMNDPSNYLISMELDNLAKKIEIANAALSDNGNGITLMSWYQVQREIMGKTDDEIKEILNELRLESSLAIELQRTPEIIKRTGIFDTTDRIYGEPGANYSEGIPNGEGGAPGGGGGFAGGGGMFGGDMMGDDMMDDEMGMDDMGSGDDMPDMGGDNGDTPPLNEGRSILTEYFDNVLDKDEKCNNTILGKSAMLNEVLNKMINELDLNVSEKKNLND